MQQQSGAASTAPHLSVQYTQRRRTALWCTVVLLALSIIVLLIGLLSASRTSNVAVAGYYSGIILSFGAFLGIVGLNVVENRKPMLVASIVFVSLGVVACFLCAIVDGIIAAQFLDRRPLVEGRCEFYSSSSGYVYDNYYTEVVCQSYNSECNLKVKSNTCYCCDLYSCDSSGYPAHYFEFTGVSGCWDVVHLYRLLWSCVVLNVLGVFLGIVTAAILGAFKDLVPGVQNQASVRPAAPPHVLYNPTQHMLSYAGFCPSGQALPNYPNYPVPMQHPNGYPAASAAQPSCDVAPSPSEESQPVRPGGDQAADAPGHMLTPNAPSLYSAPSGPFEKPPPYAC